LRGFNYFHDISNKRRPSPSLALRIERATGGVVTRDELLFPELYQETPAIPTAQDAL
jgi:DNA-binding transcriptional regulator YdaS (Cro superfamily)